MPEVVIFEFLALEIKDYFRHSVAVKRISQMLRLISRLTKDFPNAGSVCMINWGKEERSVQV